MLMIGFVIVCYQVIWLYLLQWQVGRVSGGIYVVGLMVGVDLWIFSVFNRVVNFVVVLVILVLGCELVMMLVLVNRCSCIFCRCVQWIVIYQLLLFCVFNQFIVLVQKLCGIGFSLWMYCSVVNRGVLQIVGVGCSCVSSLVVDVCGFFSVVWMCVFRCYMLVVVCSIGRGCVLMWL